MGEIASGAEAALKRIVAALDRADVLADQAIAALAAMGELRERLDAWEPRLITAARADGASWADIAPALGVASRQAAERRYLRSRRSDQDPVGATGEDRVDAERDRRAGQRAVSDWARANGADLRQLAGQVSALTDLGSDAQDSLDRLHHALGGSDPAALVPLLHDTHEHLQERHTALADRIDAIADHTDQIRRSTLQRRDRARLSRHSGDR